MAIAHVQDLAVVASTGGGSSLQSTAFGTSPTTGNTIIVTIWTYDNADGSISSVVDSTGANTYTPVDKANDNAPRHCFVYRASNITGGSTFKITVTTNGNAYITFTATEISGLTNSSPLDGAGATATGVVDVTQPHTGTYSTTNANDLLIATFVIDYTLSLDTQPTGFSAIGNQVGDGTVESGGASYQIVAAAQTNIDPAWVVNIAAGTAWAAVGVGYQMASAIIAAIPKLYMLDGP